MSDELHDAFGEICESLDAAGVFAQADRTATAERLADGEWTRERTAHVHDLVTFFMVGVSSADVWHHGYTLPPDFSDVVNRVAAKVQARWPGEEVVRISVFDYEQLLDQWIAEDPQAMAWNETDGPQIVATSRYAKVPDRRDFIDLGALTRNAAMAFRRDADQFEKSSADFDARWKAEHPDEDAA